MAKVVMNEYEAKLAVQDKNAALEPMLKRFKKQVLNSGILQEVKDRQFFLKKSLKRKEKSKRAKIARLKSERKRKTYN